MPTGKIEFDEELKAAFLELPEELQKRVARLVKFMAWKNSGRKPVNTTWLDLLVGAWIYFTEYLPSNQVLVNKTK